MLSPTFNPASLDAVQVLSCKSVVHGEMASKNSPRQRGCTCTHCPVLHHAKRTACGCCRVNMTQQHSQTRAISTLASLYAGQRRIGHLMDHCTSATQIRQHVLRASCPLMWEYSKGPLQGSKLPAHFKSLPVQQVRPFVLHCTCCMHLLAAYLKCAVLD